MGNKETVGKGTGNYTRRLEVRHCTAPKCTELFQAAIGRNAAYCSDACKVAASRFRIWAAQQEKERIAAA